MTGSIIAQYIDSGTIPSSKTNKGDPFLCLVRISETDMT